MELRHLRYFVAVAEELNVRRAAARLHVSQPPLTRQIHDLEEEVKAKLLKRKHGVQLTEAGRIFLAEARQILSLSERAAQLAQAAERGEAGHLTIAVPPMALDPMLSHALRLFRQRFPMVTLEIKEMVTARQTQALLDRRIDLGYCSFRSPEAEPDLIFKPVRHAAMCVALHPGHPFAEHRRIRLSALANEPFIVPTRRAPIYYDWYLNLCRLAGFDPRIAQEADSGQSMLGLASVGIGVALVPETLRQFQSAADVEIRNLEADTPHLIFHLAWHRSSTPPALDVFLKVFSKETRIRARFKRVSL